MSFFSVSKFKRKKPSFSFVPKCGMCGLHKKCVNPRIPYMGKGRKKILIVSEFPTKVEDEERKVLNGEYGYCVKKYLHRLGVDLEKDCWRVNAVCCHTTHHSIDDSKIIACRPLLLKTVHELDPNVIIILGWIGVKSLIGSFYKEKTGPLSLWAGNLIPNQNPNVWILPTFHPTYLDQNPYSSSYVLFEKHLSRAVKKHKTKPWSDVPDYRSEVKILFSTSDAVSFLERINKQKGTIAFDYESNCIKPEYPKARIYSCSVCWNGEETVAFPWSYETKKSMKKVLTNPDIKKIAANMKFEDRWSRFTGIKIKGWLWDTMLAAHMLDNRPGAAGLKYQSYVQLGLGDYNSHLDDFLSTKDWKHYNRIEEVDREELLLYNGIDSLVTYKIAQIQMKRSGKEPYDGQFRCTNN